MARSQLADVVWTRTRLALPALFFETVARRLDYESYERELCIPHATGDFPASLSREEDRRRLEARAAVEGVYLGSKLGGFPTDPATPHLQSPRTPLHQGHFILMAPSSCTKRVFAMTRLCGQKSVQSLPLP
jgi:hypothetical protein